MINYLAKHRTPTPSNHCGRLRSYLAAGTTPTVSYAPTNVCRKEDRSVLAVCPEQYLTTMRVHRYFRYMNEAEIRSTEGFRL